MSLASLITLSVVSHGHGPLLLRLLDDLDALHSLQGATVLVTLNSPDERIDLAHYQHLSIQTLRNPVPKGFGANHNAAFKRCTTPWFAILNPDLRIVGDIFSGLITSGNVSNAALLAPRVVDNVGVPEDSVRANLTPWSVIKRVAGLERLHTSVLEAGFRWYAGMFYLVRSTAYAAVGGFDESYFLYCEDFDLCARMHLDGMPIAFEPTFGVVHAAQRASHRSGRHLRMHLVSLLRVWLSPPVWRIALKDALCAWRRLV